MSADTGRFGTAEFFAKQLFESWAVRRQQVKGLQRQAKRLRKARQEIERLRTQNEDLLMALKLALNSHGVTLPTDPPQEAWKVHLVEKIARAAIAKAEGKA